MENYPFLEGLDKFKTYPLNYQNSLFCITWKCTLIFEEVYIPGGGCQSMDQNQSHFSVSAIQAKSGLHFDHPCLS